jgi:hypothetical protein
LDAEAERYDRPCDAVYHGPWECIQCILSFFEKIVRNIGHGVGQTRGYGIGIASGFLSDNLLKMSLI